MSEKSFSLPSFIQPTSPAEARQRLAELNMALASINDQIECKRLDNSLDGAWLQKANTSKRYKNLEKDRLSNWLIDNSFSADAKSLNDIIVELVHSEFEEHEWASIVAEARSLFSNHQ